jgi:hypothetical protein
LGSGTFPDSGLDSENAMTMINGVSMNKSYDGRPQGQKWGGLNDAIRIYYRYRPFRLYFGGILGTQESIPALPFIEQEQELLFREPQNYRGA